MRRELVIGLDIGTTNIKAVLFNIKGNLIAEAEKKVVTYYSNHVNHEQNPLELEKSSVQVIKQVIKKGKVKSNELLSIGISCAMHSIICVDKNNNPLSPMIIWSDGRGTTQVKNMSKAKTNKLYEKTGVPVHPMTPFAKLLWMKQTGFKPFQEAYYFMTMKDFLMKRWFNKHIIDYSMAASTGLLNIHMLDWDKEILDLVGIEQSQLGKIVEPTELVTSLNENIADEMEIEKDTLFSIGAADGQMANLGSGAITSNEINISMGTSGAVRQFTEGTPISKKMNTFAYPLNTYKSIIGGATNNGGIALQWLKGLLEFKGNFSTFLKSAEKTEVGANGIIFLPYINGERAPLWNQQAQGVFWGLNINHTKEDMIRAVLEGITFNIYKISKELKKITSEFTKVSINGGLTQSSFWLQIVADILGKEVYVTNTHHNVAWGASWTSLVAIGRVKSFELIKENMPNENIVFANEKNHILYESSFKKYNDLLNQLEPLFI